MAIIIGSTTPSFPGLPKANLNDNGLYGKRYVGHDNDNTAFYDTAPLHGDTSLNTEISNFTSGSDFYSWMWIGYFKPPTSGTYTFYTSSDDGSYLWIGDNALTGYNSGNATVNNGGLHGGVEQSGTVSLVGGKYYPIRITFSEYSGGDYVTVSFEGPGVSKTTNGNGYYFGGAFW